MRLVGVDVGERELRLARAERVFGTLKLTGIERAPFADPSELPALLARLVGPKPHLLLAAFPAARVTHRILTLPFHDARRLARAVPLELLGQLPAEPEDALVAFRVLGRVSGGTTVLAVVARRAEVESHAARLAAVADAPVRVALAPLAALDLLPPGAPDAALLLADGARSSLVVWRQGRLSGLRALDASAAEPRALVGEVRWSLAALGGAPTRLVLAGPDAAGMGDALACATDASVVTLDQAAAPVARHPNLAAAAVATGLVVGAGRRNSTGLALLDVTGAASASPRRAATLAGVALALGLVDLALLHHDLVRRDAMLQATIRTEAAAALPGTMLVAPRAQLEEAASAAARRQAHLGGATSPLEVLREISLRLPPQLRLDLDEVVIDPDAVHVHGRAETFQAVDAVKRALAGSPLLAEVSADETRTTVDGRRVEFRLHAVRRAAGAPS
jgi:hypothetical protein